MEEKGKKWKAVSVVIVVLVLLAAIFYYMSYLNKNNEFIKSDGNQTVKEFLWGRSIIVPQKILKANRGFSEVTIVYGPPPRKWKKGRKNEMIWITGNDPDSQISFKFKLTDQK